MTTPHRKDPTPVRDNRTTPTASGLPPSSSPLEIDEFDEQLSRQSKLTAAVSVVGGAARKGISTPRTQPQTASPPPPPGTGRGATPELRRYQLVDNVVSSPAMLTSLKRKIAQCVLEVANDGGNAGANGADASALMGDEDDVDRLVELLGSHLRNGQPAAHPPRPPTGKTPGGVGKATPRGHAGGQAMPVVDEEIQRSTMYGVPADRLTLSRPSAPVEEILAASPRPAAPPTSADRLASHLAPGLRREHADPSSARTEFDHRIAPARKWIGQGPVNFSGNKSEGNGEVKPLAQRFPFDKIDRRMVKAHFIQRSSRIVPSSSSSWTCHSTGSYASLGHSQSGHSHSATSAGVAAHRGVLAGRHAATLASKVGKP